MCCFTCDLLNFKALRICILFLEILDMFIETRTVHKIYMDNKLWFYKICLFLAVIGVACLGYSSGEKDALWPSGVKYLKENGLSDGKVKLVGSGIICESITVAFMIVSCIIYGFITLSLITRRAKKVLI